MITFSRLQNQTVRIQNFASVDDALRYFYDKQRRV